MSQQAGPSGKQLEHFVRDRPEGDALRALRGRLQRPVVICALSENLAKWAYYLSLSIPQYWYRFGTLPVAKSSFAPENSVR